MRGEIFTTKGYSYNIEKLISNRGLIEKTLREMKQCGYIEPVPFTEVCHFHPLLFLPKGTDKIRLVCDMTECNGYFKHVKGDLPGTEQLLRSIPDTWVVYAKIDIRNGFFRVPLHPEIRNFFGFLINGQRWRFCVTPQGWLLSPGIFHERICRITSDLGVISYVDDLLIGAPNRDELANKVNKVLARLSAFGLKKLNFR